SDDKISGTAKDSGVFGADATNIYGGGDCNDPVQQQDGSMTKSDSLTDLTTAIDGMTGKALDVAPVTTGTSWQFDGSAQDPLLTNIGYQVSQFTQIDNKALWF